MTAAPTTGEHAPDQTARPRPRDDADRAQRRAQRSQRQADRLRRRTEREQRRSAAR